MDIGRLIKLDDYETSDTPLSLKNIHLSEDNQEVTFAFYSNSEKVLLKTDVPSMENFVTQKVIEEYIFLQPTSPSTFDFTFETLAFSNVEKISPTFKQKVLSFLADIAPVLGTVKGASELYYGIDPITGQEVSRIIAGFGLAGSFIPLPGSKIAGKFVSKSVEFTAELLAKNANSLKNGITKMIRSLPGKATGGHSLPLIKEGDTWLRGTQSNAGKVPKQIADKLRDKEFTSWDHFRKSFWKEVANDPVLSKNFSNNDLYAMKTRGTAPVVEFEQQLGKIDSYILHHEQPIHAGGGLYNIDNLKIVTPRYHKEILEPKYHYKKE
jgi:hypothetical protein